MNMNGGVYIYIHLYSIRTSTIFNSNFGKDPSLYMSWNNLIHLNLEVPPAQAFAARPPNHGHASVQRAWDDSDRVSNFLITVRHQRGLPTYGYTYYVASIERLLCFAATAAIATKKQSLLISSSYGQQPPFDQKLPRSKPLTSIETFRTQEILQFSSREGQLDVIWLLGIVS